MNTSDLAREALRGVRLHRARTAAAAACFAAGTAAAIALGAAAGGARARILAEIAALGTDVVAVRPVGTASSGAPPALALEDAEALRDGFPFIATAAPIRRVASSVLLPDERVTVAVVGTTADYFMLRRLEFRRGRPFTADEVARGAGVCILGAAASRDLFPTSEPFGSLVKVGGNWYRVVGVLGSDPANPMGTGAQDEGREIYLPITATWRGLGGRREALSALWLRLDGRVEPRAASTVLARALVRRHQGAEHFEVTTAADLLAREGAARRLLDRLLAAVAAFALGLGGVAMASVAWQASRQRAREIAIRRAVGAQRAEVLAQLLGEGVLVAGGGAVAGVVLGIAGSVLAASLGGWSWVLSFGDVLTAAGLALAIGLLSTAIPAARAAALDPVAALREDA